MEHGEDILDERLLFADGADSDEAVSSEPQDEEEQEEREEQEQSASFKQQAGALNSSAAADAAAIDVPSERASVCVRVTEIQLDMRRGLGGPASAADRRSPKRAARRRRFQRCALLRACAARCFLRCASAHTPLFDPNLQYPNTGSSVKSASAQSSTLRASLGERSLHDAGGDGDDDDGASAAAAPLFGGGFGRARNGGGGGGLGVAASLPARTSAVALMGSSVPIAIPSMLPRWKLAAARGGGEAAADAAAAAAAGEQAAVAAAALPSGDEEDDQQQQHQQQPGELADAEQQQQQQQRQLGAPAAGVRRGAPAAFVPPHKLTRHSGEFACSLNDAPLERLRTRNAVLRRTGFLEARVGSGGGGGGSTAGFAAPPLPIAGGGRSGLSGGGSSGGGAVGGVAQSLPAMGGMMMRFEAQRLQPPQQPRQAPKPSSLTAALATIGEAAP